MRVYRPAGEGGRRPGHQLGPGAGIEFRCFQTCLPTNNSMAGVAFSHMRVHRSVTLFAVLFP